MADKYEPYEKPSAVPGLAVTGAGIGALAYLARRLKLESSLIQILASSGLYAGC